MNRFLDVFAETALDVLAAFGLLSIVSFALVAVWIACCVLADRKRPADLDCRSADPVDFAGEIHAFRTARDREEAGERRVLR